MKDDLVRFGVAMEASLVEELDKLAAARGGNRSELLRDLARAELGREKLSGNVPAFASVTLVYNHHVRELSEKLTSLQHELGEQVRSAMHVHLDHEHCLEIVVMQGNSDQLKETANRMVGTRGVVQGAAEYIATETLSLSNTGRRTHFHEHDGRWHAHPHEPEHAHESPPKRTKKTATKAKR